MNNPNNANSRDTHQIQKTNLIHVPQILFIIAIGGLTLVNLIQSTTQLVNLYPRKQPKAFNFAGKKFEGIEPILTGNKYVAYYTDQNLEAPGPLMELQQAQYTLAPVILDPGSLDHRYIIINCANIPKAIIRMKEIGARPVKANNQGIILAERPQVLP